MIFTAIPTQGALFLSLFIKDMWHANGFEVLHAWYDNCNCGNLSFFLIISLWHSGIYQGYLFIFKFNVQKCTTYYSVAVVIVILVGWRACINCMLLELLAVSDEFLSSAVLSREKSWCKGKRARTWGRAWGKGS